MHVNGVAIEETFAEAFPMSAARLIVTAANDRWARIAAENLTGFATSVIGCKCESGIERVLEAEETPDGRPGRSILLFAMRSEDLAKRLIERVGQSIMTCPTTACFDGLSAMEKRVVVGGALRVFGDGFQASKVIDGQRYCRIPVMDDEFVVSDRFGVTKGIGGGNFLILARTAEAALEAAEAAVDAIRKLPDVIMPFPGGIVRSGSKVGSRRYAKLVASTNDAYCPTLVPRTESALPGGVNSVLEIVLDGLTQVAVATAMQAGIRAACREGVLGITAGNYGGKLGPHHFHLHDLLAGAE